MDLPCALAWPCGMRSGFPAHAGMDPEATPFGRTQFREHGFPAHAGMDLWHIEARAMSAEMAVSPPTRGWTH